MDEFSLSLRTTEGLNENTRRADPFLDCAQGAPSLAHGEFAKPGEFHRLPLSQAIRDLVQYLLDTRFAVMWGQTDLAPHRLIQILARDCPS